MRLFGTAWVVKDGAVVGRMVVSESGYTDEGAEQQERFRELIRDRWLEAATAKAETAVLEWGPIGQSWAEQREPA